MTKLQLDDLLGEEPPVKEANFKKQQFDQRDGQYLLKLQQSYNDDRFKLTDRFQDDLNLKKISKKAQLDTQEARRGPSQTSHSEEQNNLLKILGEVCPDDKRFIDSDVKHKKQNNFLVKRFDPSQLKTHQLVIKKEPVKPKKEKFVPKIEKGIDKKKINSIKGEQKLKSIQANKTFVKKVKKVNSEGWKTVLQEDNKSFSLFG